MGLLGRANTNSDPLAKAATAETSARSIEDRDYQCEQFTSSMSVRDNVLFVLGPFVGP